jgi:hypothetical protein
MIDPDGVAKALAELQGAPASPAAQNAPDAVDAMLQLYAEREREQRARKRAPFDSLSRPVGNHGDDHEDGKDLLLAGASVVAGYLFELLR